MPACKLLLVKMTYWDGPSLGLCNKYNPALKSQWHMRRVLIWAWAIECCQVIYMFCKSHLCRYKVGGNMFIYKNKIVCFNKRVPSFSRSRYNSIHEVYFYHLAHQLLPKGPREPRQQISLLMEFDTSCSMGFMTEAITQ